jgi:crotonobetainyl-CoA:carnitine CoA-transferase CaiB-like acyl-CoA transferase
MRDVPGFDPVIQALSGIMSITGEEGGSSVRVGTSLVDMGAGMWAAIGVLASLCGSGTRKDVVVSTSLLETAFAWMPYQIMGYMATGTTPRKWGSELAMLSPYGAYAAADAEIVVAVGNEEIWKRLCRCLDREDLVDTPGFRSNAERVQNRQAVKAELEKALAVSSAEVWEGLFHAEGIPAARVNLIPEALELEQTVAISMLQQSEAPEIQDFKSVRLPLTFDQPEAAARSHPPTAGQHSREILQGLGYSDNDFIALKRAGVIGS